MFLSDHSCLILQYDWSSGSFAVTWFFLGVFWVTWRYGSLKYNLKLMALSPFSYLDEVWTNSGIIKPVLYGSLDQYKYYFL